MPVLCRDWTRTIFLRGPDEDYTMSTKGRMMERLRVILAGRAAEEVPICVHLILHHPSYLQLVNTKELIVHQMILPAARHY